MNERLKKDFNKWMSENEDTAGFFNPEELAQHFYNLALEDVKKEVLKLNKINKQIAEEKGECSKWQEGVSAGYAEVLSTIDQLSK